AGLATLRRRRGDGTGAAGLVLVGSHVPLADAQLERLLAEPGCGGVEIPVARVQRVLEGPLPERLLASLEEDWQAALEGRLAAGRTPVLFTSRGELECRHAAERRALGQALAASMARLAGRLAPGLGYVISKGGITSHTLLAEGLGLAQVELQGQLLPGLSLVRGGQGGVPGAAGLPVLTLPGNLGDAGTLVDTWQRMEGA
ncbi:MAG: nucleotide-binding domain containing protein, partial [Cyanobium sp.]